MSETLTPDQVREVHRQLGEAQTAAQVREIFKASYGQMGWKRLCRMFVLGHTPEQVLKERDRG